MHGGGAKNDVGDAVTHRDALFQYNPCIFSIGQLGDMRHVRHFFNDINGRLKSASPRQDGLGDAP
jgi:hypothetical protein